MRALAPNSRLAIMRITDTELAPKEARHHFRQQQKQQQQRIQRQYLHHHRQQRQLAQLQQQHHRQAQAKRIPGPYNFVLDFDHYTTTSSNHDDQQFKSRTPRLRHNLDGAASKLVYRHPPFFITFISIFQLVVFVYYALMAEEPISLIGPVPFHSKLIYNPYRRYEVWRYLTYMFIHAGYWHLSFNLIIQLAVGIPLELVHKFNPIFIIYVGGVIGGALGNSIADPHSYLAGASSGCYALIAAHLSNLIINWDEITGACCRLITLIAFSATDLGTAIYERHIKYGTAYRTSYGGHLAGATSGLLLGLIFLRNVKVYQWEQDVKKWAAAIYFTMIFFAIVFNATSLDHFPLPDRKDLIWSQTPFGIDRE